MVAEYQEIAGTEIIPAWLYWLDMIASEGKDTTDPTFLMQAFRLTRQQALAAIAYWEAQDG